MSDELMRRVEIIGRCNQTDVPSLEAAIRSGQANENFHSLCSDETRSPSLSLRSQRAGGLPNWAKEQIHAIGTLPGPGYWFEDIAEDLRKLCRKAPTLEVAIHVGEMGLSTKCVATIVGLGAANGQDPMVTVLTPQVENICALPNESQAGMLLSAMQRHQ